jgi:hypothetical protein
MAENFPVLLLLLAITAGATLLSEKAGNARAGRHGSRRDRSKLHT